MLSMQICAKLQDLLDFNTAAFEDLEERLTEYGYVPSTTSNK
jgi:hypothetical protein